MKTTRTRLLSPPNPPAHTPSPSKRALATLAVVAFGASCGACVSTLKEDFRKAHTGVDQAADEGDATAEGWSTIVEMRPTAGATSVPLELEVQLTFDRMIAPGEGSVSLHETINEAEVESIPIQDETITIDDDTLVIAWDTKLSPATGYYVRIEPGSLLDEQARPFVGLTDPDAYRFTTEGPERLRLTHTTPRDGDTDVAPDTGLSFTFNEPIVAGLEGHVTITSADTNEVVESVSVTDEGRISIEEKTLNVYPQKAFSHGVQYRVTVDEGTVQSTGGSAFDGIDEGNPLTFTTLPLPPLELVHTVPKDDETNVDPTSTLVFTFSEAIAPGTGAIAVHRAEDGAVVETAMVGAPNVAVSGITLSVDLTSQLATSTEYFVTAQEGVVVTTAGASFAGISDPTAFSFTTAETTAPPLSLVKQSPATGDVDVPLGSDLSLVFSEAVVLGSGVISVLSYDGDALVEAIDVTRSDAVGVADSTVVISLSTPLRDSTKYYVTVGAGSFRSASGASFAGITDKDAWSFTTEMVFGIEETLPRDGAVDVPTTSNLELEFSDDVIIESGNIELRRSTDDALVEAVAIDSDRVRADGRHLTIELWSILGSETTYYVLIAGGALSSASGEAWNGLNDPMRWTFTTEAVDFPAGTSAGLALWLDAALDHSIQQDDTGVARWADRSGKHNDVSQSNDAARPSLAIDGINGKPAIVFDGSDALVAASIADMNAYDGFIVWQSSAAAGSEKATLFANDRNAQVNHGHPYAVSRDAAQACVGQNCTDNSGWFAAKFEPPPALDEATLWNWGFDAITTTVFARSNGSAPINQSGPTMTPWPAESPLMIGNCATPPCGFDGRISEVVVYARALRPAERSAAVDYLRKKWGLDEPTCRPDEVMGPNTSCYHLGTDLVDWTTARATCQARGIGWDLATIRTADQHQFVTGLLEGETAIGATDSDVDGTWRWVTDTQQFWNGDGSGSATNSAFTAWESGQPTATPGEACARYLLSAAGQWEWGDYVCADAHAYLCEGPAN